MSDDDDNSYGFEDKDKSKILKYYNEDTENIIKEVEDENKTTIIKEFKYDEEEDQKEDDINKLNNTSKFNNLEIIEKHDKINEESLNTSKKNNDINNDIEEISTSKKHSELFSNNENKSLLSPSKIDINTLKTESDIKEEINESHKDLNIILDNSFLPQSVISQANKSKRNSLNIPQKLSKDKLNIDNNTPLKINKSINLFSKSSSKDKNNNKKITSLLPRISSAKNLKKSNSKLFLMKSENENENKEHTYLNKRKKISGIPLNPKSKLFLSMNKSTNKLLEIIKNKKNEEEIDNELYDMEKENLTLIRELEKLNIQLNNLINKQTPKAVINYNKTHPKHKSVQPSTPEILKQSEIIMQKKYLTNLISEYNKLYSKYNIEYNNNTKDELKKEIELKKIEYKNCLIENKNLKDKIYQNQNYLKNSHIQQKTIIINYEDFESKIDLYKKKISKTKNDLQRMELLYKNENKKILSLNEKYLRFKEILDNYETPNSLKNKLFDKDTIKKYEEQKKKLIRKKNIIIHSRNSMKNNYIQEINKQKKYIEQLKNTIYEVNNILTSME